MKRRSFIAGAVAGAAAIAGCYAVADSGLVDLDGFGGGPDDTTGTPTPTTEPPGEQPKDPGIDIRDTEFVPGSGAPGDRGCLRMTIENVGGERLSSVDLRPQFFDAAGRRLRGSYRSLVNLDPGETWVLCDRYPGSGSEVDGHVVTGSFYPGTTVTDPGDVELLDERFRADDCRVGLSGAVRNAGDTAVPYLQALVTFYAEDGTVVASGYDHTLDLESGGLWDYEVIVDATTLAEPATRHRVELSGPWW